MSVCVHTGAVLRYSDVVMSTAKPKLPLSEARMMERALLDRDKRPVLGDRRAFYVRTRVRASDGRVVKTKIEKFPTAD